MSKTLNKSKANRDVVSLPPFFENKRYYFDHDDRMGKNNEEINQEKFKPCAFKIRLNKYLERTFPKRNNPLSPRSNFSPFRNRNFKGIQFGPKVQCLGRDFNWYKIIIPYGYKYKKDYILKSLLSYMEPEVFIPIMYKITGYEAHFYVDDHKTANALLNCNYKITMKDGFKLQVRVKPEFPRYEINDKYKEQLKQALPKRYMQESNALDLSKFHQDPDLIDNFCCALFRPSILLAVLDIVSEHIPTLEALSLDSNKLYKINILGDLNKKFPKLKILHIGDNKIKDIYQIDAIKDLKLEELKLAGNPVCNNYKSQPNEYICDIRKRFPKLLRLDDMELPKPIVFDVIDTVKLPQSQRILFTDTNSHKIACQFLHQYFTTFDSKDRQFLFNAYSELAYFSMTITTIHFNKLSKYIKNNWNLFRIRDSPRRQQLLKCGRLPVVSLISQMPQTKHLLDTFTMDVAFVTQTMIFITITGYFQELDNEEQPIHHFNRTFVIVSEDNRYCICNEQLHIGQPSEAQIQQLNEKLEPKTPELLPVDTARPIALELSDNISDNKMKQQMIVMLSQQTNMNVEWSLKCLHELQWNYNNALSAFQEAFKHDQIPSEAFMKFA